MKTRRSAPLAHPWGGIAPLPLLLALLLPPSGADPGEGEDGAAPKRRPNILFILTDDHSTAAIGAYGSTLVPTPHLDRLAAEGVRFDRLYCTNPICAPSRASILTGLSSVHNGVIDNVERFDPNLPTFPKVFRANGYRTGLFGKWHLKSTPTGFDRFAVLPGQGHYYNPDLLFSDPEGGPPERRRIEGHSTERITDLALEWLFPEDAAAAERPAASEPFLLLLQYKAPHRNWMPAPAQLGLLRDPPLPLPETLHDTHPTRSAASREQEMSIAEHMHLFYDLKWRGGPQEDGLGKAMNGLLERMSPAQRALWDAAYAAEDAAFGAASLEGKALVEWKARRYLGDYLRCIAGVDDQIGRVLAALEDRGILDDTIVIYTSDQGFFLGEHGWYDKRFLYEESARMPFIVRHPATIEAGRVDRSLRQNFDIAPTLLEAAQLPPLAGIDGRSFWGAVAGRPEEEPPSEVYGHYFEYPGVHAVKRHVGIRTERWKLIHFYHDIDAWELYDLQSDPDERVNRIGDPTLAGVRRELEARLDDLRERYEDDPGAIDDALAPRKVAHDGRGLAVSFDPAPRRDHGGDPAVMLTDGVARSGSRFAPRTREGWLGFREGPLTLELALDKPRSLSSVALHLLDEPASWIHLPRAIELWTAGESGEFTRKGVVAPPRGDGGGSARWVELGGVETEVSRIRVRIEPLVTIPPGSPGAGKPPWLFIDEVALRFAE